MGRPERYFLSRLRGGLLQLASQRHCLVFLSRLRGGLLQIYRFLPWTTFLSRLRGGLHLEVRYGA